MGILALIVVLAFGALVMVTLLGSKASVKYTRIRMDDNPGATYPTDTLAPEESSSTTPLSPALVDPVGTIATVCHSIGHDRTDAAIPDGFNPIPNGGNGSFAQVVRPVYDTPRVIATFDLGSGTVEKSSDATRLETTAAASSVVVCVGPDEVPVAPALLCASPHPGIDGSPERYSVINARRYRGRVFELASGRMLGEGAIVADVTDCQDGYSKVASNDVGADEQRLRSQAHSLWTADVDVTDDQIVSWAVAHVKGGTFH